MSANTTWKRAILIINPNTTQSMTDNLIPLIDKLGFNDTNFSYLTAPSGVPSINNETDILTSTAACLSFLKQHEETYLLLFDAFLICCYSPHPLVPQLRSLLTSLGIGDKLVTGIFEASIAFCLQSLNVDEKLGIVSTGAQWEGILGKAVEELLGGRSERFVGTETTGLNADELHAVDAGEMEGRMMEATRRLVKRGARAVVLGCAGMVGLDGVVRRGCVEALGEGGWRVRIVDGVVSGVLFLEGALRADGHV